MYKQKICILGPLRSAIGGVSTHLNLLLGSNLASEFRFSYFSIGSEGRSESRLAMLVRLIFSPCSFALHLLTRWPDIIHINTSLNRKAYWRDCAYMAVALLFRRKIVYQVHGGALPAKFFSGQAFRTALLRWVLKRADAVVLLAHSEVVAYRAFAPTARLHLIPNCIDPTPLLNEKQHAIDRPPVLAYIGRLERTKGVLDVLQAIELLSQRGIMTQLLIAGGGTQESDLRAFVAEHGLQERVTFLGSVFGSSRDSVWRRADVFAFPTFHPEGLPYSLLEAMAAGAVPITSRAGAIEDVVIDGTNGILVPARNPVAFADAVESLHRDRDLLARLSRNAVARIKSEYSVSVMQERFRALYTQVGDGSLLAQES